MQSPLLRVTNLRVSFPSTLRGDASLTVVREATFSVGRGEIFALVGESGCGKSVTALSLARLPPTDQALIEGTVQLGDQDLLSLKSRDLRRVRGRGLAYVFQDPGSALNPVLRIDGQLREALPPGLSAREVATELPELLRLVQLTDPARVLRSYPHELSGGMQQRVMVAMAAAARPALLVADEPTTALDVTTQQQVLELLDQLRRERGMGILFITHNLGLVARYADRVGVMYAGEIVESGEVPAVLRNPRHPYTQGLLAAVPRLDMQSIDDLRGIPGRVPNPSDWPVGCAFAPRCPQAAEACRSAPIPLRTDSVGRCCRCLFAP